MFKKSLLFVSLAVAVGSVSAAPYAFNARQDAMGGTGVSGANYLAAPFYNPALLATADESDDFGVLLPVVGAQAFDKDNLRDQVDDINDSYDSFKTAYDNYSANPTADNAQQLTDLNNKVANQLRNLSGDSGYVNAGAGAAVALPTKAISSALFFNAYADVAAFTDIDSNDLTDYTVNGVTIQVPNDEANINSKAIAMGALVSDIGLSFAKTYPTALGNTSFGVSPKVQQVRVINYVASAVNADYGDITDDKYQTKENGFNFDLGVSNDFGNGLTTGLAVKNVIKRDIAAPIINGVQAQYEIGPAPTASVTYKVGGGLTVSSDLDLLPQKRFTSLSGTTSKFNASDDDLQMWSAGLEEDVFGWLQLRAGYRHDLKGNLDDAYTAGIGISPFKVFHLDVAGIYGGKDEVGAVVQTSFTF